MSRSVKHPPLTRCSWSEPDPSEPPGTEKAGSRFRPKFRGRNARQGWLLSDRRTFGPTEKILRRNAPIWRRLFSKAGRRVDRAAIRESVEAS